MYEELKKGYLVVVEAAAREQCGFSGRYSHLQSGGITLAALGEQLGGVSSGEASEEGGAC